MDLSEKNPQVSILLPTHNRSEVLPFAIQSALLQTYADFELLIVGDGCTDNTEEVVKEFQSKDERIKWFNLPKAPGFGAANRNVASEQARGNLIAFLAHDDIWMPDHLELALKVFEDPKIELVHSRPVWISHENHIIPICFNLKDPQTLKNFLDFKYNAIPASAIVHRKDCYDKYGMWNSELLKNLDWDLWIRILAPEQGRNCAFISEATALHFHANWKNSTTQVLEHIKTWREYYLSIGDSVPEILRMPIEELPQQAYSRMINSDPKAFTKKLREAIVQIIDMRVMLADQFLHTVNFEPKEFGKLSEYLRSKLL